MTSRFQQCINQLQPGYYRVVIADMTVFSDLNDPTGGRITPNTGDSFESLCSTLELANARVRGNMRFRNIINRLLNIADCQIIDVEIDEANADVVPDSLKFTVKFDRPAGVLDAVQLLIGPIPYVGYDDVTEIDTIEKALQDQIARGIGDETSALTKVAYVHNNVTFDSRMKLSVSAPAATDVLFNSVSVELIDGTEIISVN